jgi:hypothetical protein
MMMSRTAFLCDRHGQATHQMPVELDARGRLALSCPEVALMVLLSMDRLECEQRGSSGRVAERVAVNQHDALQYLSRCDASTLIEAVRFWSKQGWPSVDKTRIPRGWS